MRRQDLLRSLLLAGSLAGLALPAAPPPALAQFGTSSEPSEPTLPRPARAPRRIDIYPGRLLYRQCDAWLEIQHRPSGTVLFPEKRCWWVRG